MSGKIESRYTQEELNKMVINSIMKLRANHFDGLESASEGGEGKVYNVNNKIVKVFSKDKVDINAKGKKVCQLMKLRFMMPEETRFALPQELIIESGISFDNKTKTPQKVTNPVGFTMTNIKGKELALLNSKRTCAEYKVDLKKLLQMLLIVRYDMHLLHENGIVIGDLNERNILFDKNLVPYIIDCDSWAINELPCEVIMTNYKDPKVRGNAFNRESDNFAFMVLTFKMLTRVHPFGGTHPNPKFKDMLPDEKIKHHAHLLTKGVGLPFNARNFNILSDELIKCFKDFFEGKRRHIGKELENFYANLRECKKCKEMYWRGRGNCPCCKSDEYQDIETIFDPNKMYKGIKITDEVYVPEKHEVKKPIITSFRLQESEKRQKAAEKNFDLSGINTEPPLDPAIIKTVFTLQKDKLENKVVVNNDNSFNIYNNNGKQFAFSFSNNFDNFPNPIAQIDTNTLLFIDPDKTSINLLEPNAMGNNVSVLRQMPKDASIHCIAVDETGFVMVLGYSLSQSSLLTTTFKMKRNQKHDLKNDTPVKFKMKAAGVEIVYNNTCALVLLYKDAAKTILGEAYVMHFASNTIKMQPVSKLAQVFANHKSVNNSVITKDNKVFVPGENKFSLFRMQADLTNMTVKTFECPGLTPEHELTVVSETEMYCKLNDKYYDLEMIQTEVEK